MKSVARLAAFATSRALADNADRKPRVAKAVTRKGKESTMIENESGGRKPSYGKSSTKLVPSEKCYVRVAMEKASAAQRERIVAIAPT